ncbi:MAG TPA: ABC transporter substrate-binding protein [Verrucomicrobiae bacterium]|nr:ABC transporter substrate-binding protein [Verrucomicrobiae bacterium]
MKTRGLSTILAALAISAAGFAGPAAADDTISCAYPFWPGFAPVHLANELGYFAEEGLTVNETFDDDRSNVLPALERGDIQCDMRTVGEHQGRPRTAETQGTIIGTIDISLGGDGVVADGSIKTAADLKGKVFAVEPNVPARLLAQLALKEHGLTFADLEVRDIASADAIAVFADPEVAAAATYEPTLTQALKASNKEGAHILVSSRDYPGLITDVIVARTDDLKANPEQYRKFLRGIYRAIDYFKTNRADAIKIMAPHFKLSPEEYEELLVNLEYTPYEEAVDYLGTGGQRGKLHDLFDTVMQLNLENGAADVKLDSNQQIDNSIITDLFKDHKR